MAATDQQWAVGEDWCLSIGTSVNNLIYHSSLNVILLTSKEPSVQVIDVTSGAILHKTDLSANKDSSIQCKYLPHKDKVVFVDNNAVGVRKDLNGILLLDTILQSSVGKAEDVVKVELPLPEANHLFKALITLELPGVVYVEEVLRDLEKEIEAVQQRTKGNHKVAKWATVLLEQPLCALKAVCGSMVTELRKLQHNVPGLQVASSVNDRMSYLLPNSQTDSGLAGIGPGGPVERSLMYSEASRRETFQKWPHMNYKWALPEPMAAAGFYHQPSSAGDDRAMCFTCNVCLVCWEPTDEPWSEHERHSAACPFVKGEYTHNVPISVTYATEPAQMHGKVSDKVECISNSNDEFVASCTLNGNIVVWSIQNQQKRHIEFSVDPKDPVIAAKVGSRGAPHLHVSKEDTVVQQTRQPSSSDQLKSKQDEESKIEVIEVGGAWRKEKEAEIVEIPLDGIEPIEGESSQWQRPSEDVLVTAMSIVGASKDQYAVNMMGAAPQLPSKTSKCRPCLVCGVAIRKNPLSQVSLSELQNIAGASCLDYGEVQALNQVNQALTEESERRIISGPDSPDAELNNSFVPYLLVYDIEKKKNKSKKIETKPQLEAHTKTINVLPVHQPMHDDEAMLDMKMYDMEEVDFYPDPDADVQIVGITPPVQPDLVDKIDPIIDAKDNTSQSDDQKMPSDTSLCSEEHHIKSGRVVQCIELPSEVDGRHYVHSITPTLDGQYVVVNVVPKCINETYSVLGGVQFISEDAEYESSGDSKPSKTVQCESEMVECSSGNNLKANGGMLLLYKVNTNSNLVLLEEEPVKTCMFDDVNEAILSVIHLPRDLANPDEEDAQSVPSMKEQDTDAPVIAGHIAVTTYGGQIKIINLKDVSVLATIEAKGGEKFSSLAFCSGVDRLCASTFNGNLHFYNITPGDVLDWEDIAVESGSPAKGDTTSQRDDDTSATAHESDLLVKQALSTEVLSSLCQLTQFENLTPRFSATVPQCWMEIQQEQQQRRHPQHLQQSGEAMQHTRTWRLQQDSSSWDEHLFEIVLPKPSSVGHVDLSFNLHPMCTRPPSIQVTLLKQNIINFNRTVSTEVDEPINFPLKSQSEKSDVTDSSSIEPMKVALDPQFLQKHSAEVLCGPLDLSNYVDLSGHTGSVAFTSPLLLKVKARSFLLHVKAVTNGSGKTDGKESSGVTTSTPAGGAPSKGMDVLLGDFYGYMCKPIGILPESSGNNHKPPFASKSRPKQKLDDVKGCDWINEISVTIRKSRKTSIPRDRLQRCAMLEHPTFHEQLLLIACGQDDQGLVGLCKQHRQNLALDILSWVISVQINDTNKSVDQTCIVFIVQANLKGLVKSCFIDGNRSIAHKCAKLIALCLEYTKCVDDLDVAPAFSLALVQSLMDCLPMIPTCESASAVHWFFTLLNRVKCLDADRVAQGSVELLTLVARQYHERRHPLHSLLRARYGLYGTPLDPELFDMDPPSTCKVANITPTSYATILNGSAPGSNNQPTVTSVPQSEESDFKDLQSLTAATSTDKAASTTTTSTKSLTESIAGHVHGLLEVEPLHFTCHSTSDGSRMECVDPGGGISMGSVAPSMSGTINFNNGVAPTNANSEGTAGVSTAMQSAEHQLQILQLKQLKLLKLQQQKLKLEQKLAETSKNVAAAAASMSNTNPTYSYSSELCPPTPKTTPLFMTPPMTPPSEGFVMDGEAVKMGNVQMKGIKTAVGKEPSKHSIPLVASQTLLQPPQPQVLVVDRMHSGARRFVVLDFGKPVLLTDVIIPACGDLASLSVDTWLHSEEVDGQRLVVATDIALKTLVLSDLQPPPVTRYLKITTIGRYSSGTTRSRIPIGSFYGHSFILPWETESLTVSRYGTKLCDNSPVFGHAEQSHVLSQLSLLMTLQEDIHCRYSLAQNRLQSHLNSLEIPLRNSMHTQYFLRQELKDDDKKIIHAYHDCMQLQIQLNLAQRAIARLQDALGILPTVEIHGASNTIASVRQASVDKLRCLMEHLSNTLLSMTYPTPSNPQPPLHLYKALTPQLVETLFKSCCISGTRHMQVHAGMLMQRTCGHLKWFGDFVAQVLQEYFSSEQKEIFPQHRVFLLLTVFGQKAIASGNTSGILQSVLSVLAKILTPLTHTQHGYARAGPGLDLSLLSWMLLFVSKSLDHTQPTEECSKGASKEPANQTNRWDFMHGESTLQPTKPGAKTSSSRVQHRKLQKRLMHTKQQLLELQQAKKNFLANQMEKGASAVSKETENVLKQQEIMFKKQLKQYTSKHFKDIMQMRRTDAVLLKKANKDSSQTTEQESMEGDYEPVPVLPREKCIPVVKGLTALLLSMDFTCNVDLFIVACKVLARVASVARPVVSLPEIMSQQELEQLVLLMCNIEVNYGNISWGGAWAGHAVTCLILDILEAQRLYPTTPTMSESESVTDEDMSVSMTETDDTLAKSISLGLDEDLSAPETSVETSGMPGNLDPTATTVDLPTESLLHSSPYPMQSQSTVWAKYKHVATLLPEDFSDIGGTKSAFEALDKKVKSMSSWKNKLATFTTPKPMTGPTGVSAAMDSRLENGLSSCPELRLKMMQSLEAEVIQQALTAPMPAETDLSTLSQHSSATDDDGLDAHMIFTSPQQIISSTEMLTVCFNHLFTQLQLQRVNLDNLLTLWLTLNEECPAEDNTSNTNFNSSRVPNIPLSQVSVNSLLQALVWAVHVPGRTWVLAFHTLTLLMNLKVTEGHGQVEGQSLGSRWMASVVIADSNLTGILVKFLSGISGPGTTMGNLHSSQAGPSAVQAFYEFLTRLHMRCMEENGDHLKTLLLKLVYNLAADRGTFHDGLGPLDAQCKFLEFLLDQNYEKVDINNAISVIESVVRLVHHHIDSQERVSCKTPSESGVSARSCFGGLFAHIMRNGDSKSVNGDCSRDTLMCNLLRLVRTLVSVPLPETKTEAASNTSTMGATDSLTDASKLSQALAGASVTSSGSQNIPDEQKSCTEHAETDEEKSEHLAAAAAAAASEEASTPQEPEVKVPTLSNIVLQHQPIMKMLLETLSRCNSNTMAMIIGSSGLNTNMQDSFNTLDPLSVGDTVFQFLLTLSKKATSSDMILKPLFDYISQGIHPGSGIGLCRVSEPLMWFILRVLSNEDAIRTFLQMGGVQLICRNLVHSHRRVINTAPSMVSTMMQFLSVDKGTNVPHKKLGSETENPEGLHNFAPLASITSSSPTAGPAEVLVQSSPPHRRARSAAWSYHFYPEEAWVDLTVTLPCAILLKEVHIQPHLTSLATCPGAVSLEISRDGNLCFPVCSPVSTSGLTLIKLYLHKPEITNTLTIRLHKPRDSTTIGLSQILVMGHAAFNDHMIMNASRMFLPTEDYVSRTSMGWLRLLHHCLSSLENEVASAASTVPNLMITCTAMLVNQAHIVYASNIENVLLKVGLHSVDMSLNLIDNILRNPAVVNDSVELPFHGKVSGSASEPTIDILYQLGVTQDEGTSERVKALLEWLGDSARVCLQRLGEQGDDGYRTLPRDGTPDIPSPAPAHVHTIAAILWQSQELPVTYDLQAMVTKELLNSLYEWAMVLPVNSVLKKSVDYVLCAMCYVCPEYFSQLLEWMGVALTIDLANASISDDHKDIGQIHQHQLMTDDSKEAASVPGPPVTLPDYTPVIPDEHHLLTLSVVCQSPVALKQLLDANFLAVLSQGLFEFCTRELTQHSDTLACLEMYTDASKSSLSGSRSPRSRSRHDSVESSQSERNFSLSADLVAPVLKFLAEVCHESEMKQWLGGPEGNIFWPVLLTLLCNTATKVSLWPSLISAKHKALTSDQRSAIEDAAIEFFTCVIACHQENQKLFASVLCDVVRGNGNLEHGGHIPLSGFTRRLFLQVLLEDEKVLVSFFSNSQLFKVSNSCLGRSLHHPKFGTGHKHRTLTVRLQNTCGELLTKVSDTPSLTAKLMEHQDEKKAEERKDTGELGLEVVDQLSQSAGLHAKDKRKKVWSTPGPRPPSRMGRRSSVTGAMHLPVLTLFHHLLPGQPFPGDLTLSQLLVLLHERGYPVGQASLNFSMRLRAKTVQSKSDKKVKHDQESSKESEWIDLEVGGDTKTDPISEEVLLETPSSPSALQVFASVGGLALLAEHLPLLYPEVARQNANPPSQSNKESATSPQEGLGQEWSVIMEAGEDLYEEVPEPQMMYGNQVSQPRPTGTTFPTVPPHSLVAFGLFLRLPGYAEVLLKERKRAQCLLRLVLGVADDGDGGFILTSPVATALPTLPFNVLKTLYDSSPLTTDDGVLLRRMSLEIGVLHLVLSCLSVLSHQSPRSQGHPFHQEIIVAASQAASALAPGGNNGGAAGGGSQKTLDDKAQNYWAKGTGFGTGSTTSSWDAEQALIRQKAEEEHVTCLLQVLASYINPGSQIPNDFTSSEYSTENHERNNLPHLLSELMIQSCLVPAMASYLRNDSVLDMARHVPLYRSLLEILRGIALCPSLVPLLLPLEDDDSSAICTLLDKMKGCVDTYSSRLKTNKNNSSKVARTAKSKQEEEESEGLALLIPDIQETASIVSASVSRQRHKVAQSKSRQPHDMQGAAKQDYSTEEEYMSIMKELQFDTYEMVVEEESGVRFTLSHHYESYVKSAGDVNNASRARRLAQEAVTLSTSLPLSASSSVFVRCDEERLDVMKVLITGPSETPYANGCFEFDVYFPQDYPNSPPLVNLETTGNHTVRFNPNLYNDGKVCLSVLNTWHGRPEEKWNFNTSSFLQVLVSIQSLILVSEPYFNEPGYERSRGTASGSASSREYDANIRQATVKWAMLEMLRNPSGCFKEVIHRHFWLKRHEVMAQIEEWIAEMENNNNDKRTGRTIAHSCMALKRHYHQLKEELLKMKSPDELSEDSETTDTSAGSQTAGDTLQSPSDSEMLCVADAMKEDSLPNSASTGQLAAAAQVEQNNNVDVSDVLDMEPSSSVNC